jgi:CRP-like cAMP-binding protein
MLSFMAPPAAESELSQVVILPWSKDRARATIAEWHHNSLLTAPEYFPAGANIFRPGAERRSLFLLDQGLVALERAEQRLQTRSAMFALCLPGQMFGRSSSVDEIAIPYSAIALTPCVVYAVSSHKLMHALTKGGTTGLFVIHQYVQNLLSSVIRAREVSTRNTRERFEQLLLDLALVLRPTLTGSIGLPLKDKDIASLLGISPEQLSVIKRQMASDNVISCSHRTNEMVMKSGTSTLKFCKIYPLRRKAPLPYAASILYF